MGVFSKSRKRDAETVPASAGDWEADREVFISEFQVKRKRRGNSIPRMAVWSVLTLVAMVGTVEVLLNPPAFLLKPPQVAEQKSPAWTEIRKPYAVYAFSGGQFDREPDHYGARRHSDGSRVDTISYGTFSGEKTGGEDWMRISLHRPASEDALVPGFFVDMARLASADGLAVIRHTFPNIVPTRFGAFAVSDVRMSDGKNQASCLGYRMQRKGPAFRVSGIVCGAVHAPIDRIKLACIINRLDLVSSRDDPQLRAYFSRSELKRTGKCGANKLALKSRSAWLDQVKPNKAVSALRLVSLPARQAKRR